MIVDSVNDVQAGNHYLASNDYTIHEHECIRYTHSFSATSKVRLASTPEAKEDARAKLLETILPAWLDLNEKVLKERGGKYFAGEKVLYAVGVGEAHSLICQIC